MTSEITSIEAHQLRVRNANEAISAHHRRRADYLQKVYPKRVSALRESISRRRNELAQPEIQEQLADIATRYKAINALFPSSPLERLAFCFIPQDGEKVSPFDDIHVVSDFDRSISKTDNPTDSEKVYLMPNMPGSVPLEAYMDIYGRDTLAEGFVATVQKPLRRAPHLFREGGKHAITWREGALDFFGKLRKRGIKRTILSANVKEFIHGAIGETPLADDHSLEILAMTHNDISSTDKSTAIQLLAAHNPRLAVVYIGDGASDMKIVEAYRNNAIGAIFALEGYEFDQQLIKQHIPHFTYRNFDDIDAKLEKAKLMARTFKEQAA